MNRRNFLKIAGAFGAAVTTFSPLELLAEEEIPQSEIDRLVELPTVEAILEEEIKAEKITYLKVNPDLSTNINEAIYQEGQKDKKPVLLLLYNNRDGDTNLSRRAATVFRFLAKKYGNNVKFVAHDVYKDQEKLLSVEKSRTSPRFIMYSPWDVLVGETLTSNNRKVKRIDTLVGGPARNNQVFSWIKQFGKYWIEKNLVGPFDGKTYRFSETKEFIKHVYSVKQE